MKHQGKYDDAVKIMRDILDRRRRTQGNDHADTIETLSDLGRYLILSGKYEDAEKVLREVVEVQRNKANAGCRQAWAFSAVPSFDSGNTPPPSRTFARLMAIRQKALGEDHPNTLGAFEYLWRRC